MAGTEASFEDKRRENFNKGQQELERRRQSLIDQQRREEEERKKKEKEEEEERRKQKWGSNQWDQTSVFGQVAIFGVKLSNLL